MQLPTYYGYILYPYWEKAFKEREERQSALWVEVGAEGGEAGKSYRKRPHSEEFHTLTI